MCMEDIRIGRRTSSTENLIAALAAAYQIADANNERITLIIHPPVSGTLMVSVRSDVSLTAGIPLTVGSHPLIFTIQTHGSLVMRPFFAIHSAGGIFTAVDEVLLGEQ